MVALETSILAQGLPAPDNLEAAFGCEEAIRSGAAVPATVAVIGGVLRVGLSRAEIEALGSDRSARKVSVRDLGVAAAQRANGATTVAATARAAALAGIRFFATGGIGGVHRGHPEDESADLVEIARSPVAVFCAGAKSILDLPRTLERLETLSVPVVGFRTEEFPAFYSRSSGLRVPAVAASAAECAAILAAGWALGGGGAVVAVPPPEEVEGAEEMVARAVAELAGATGPSVTPRLLARVAELSGGRSVEANVRLVVNNAAVAAAVAGEFSALSRA